jgi:cell fate (sporulation/competence/biofilm development) regulator YlbF (YheA/YmcA/DUF963 family)
MKEPQSMSLKEIWTPTQQNILQWTQQSSNSGYKNTNNTSMYKDVNDLLENYSRLKSNGSNFKSLISELNKLVSKYDPKNKVAALLKPKK